MKFGLSNKTIQAITDVFRQYPKIKKVILYGSRAKGTHKHSSDIDLTIISNSLEFNEFQQLQIALDDLMLPYIIDLSMYKDISHKELIDHIQRVGVVFYLSN
ncbi:MAG TPA: nucleotidyltransferase domain-containing protein [Caldisericia bacterium]|nr:nucleotidyltransferase domain-containing protein [Caldisericia bacterium]